MHIDVTVLEFAASVLCGVAVGAIIALVACWMLTDNTDAEIVRALAASVEAMAGKGFGKNKHGKGKPWKHTDTKHSTSVSCSIGQD